MVDLCQIELIVARVVHDLCFLYLSSKKEQRWTLKWLKAFVGVTRDALGSIGLSSGIPASY